MTDRNNPQANPWTKNEDQREIFLTDVDSTIIFEARLISYWYHLGPYREDIESELRAWLLQQMEDMTSPFDRSSPEESASFYLKEKPFAIREQGRSYAKKVGRERVKQAEIANNPLKQAEILAAVHLKNFSSDEEKAFLRVVKSIPRIVSEIPKFTPKQCNAFKMEVLRKMGVDDFPGEIFEAVAQIVGISSLELRSYIDRHKKLGHNSENDRQTWGRARAKAKKVFTQAKLTSLFGIVAILSSLALFTYLDHQWDFASQNHSTYQMARLKAHQ